MDADLALVIGIVLGVFSVPAMMATTRRGRLSISPVLVAAIALGLVVYAFNRHPGGYGFEDLPRVFSRVIARFAP